ncbi:MAG TPA: Rieske 2Fe-2S domain-containing protein [Casimicrobiaceae bacterium]
MHNDSAAKAFVEVALAHDIAEGTATTVAIPVATVALFKVGGRIFGIDDTCVRCGRSLAAGALRGTTVTCTSCGWYYDLATGSVNDIPSLRTDTFEVKVVEARHMVAHIAQPVDEH